MKNKINSLSESVFDYVCGAYKYLHANPELAFQETNTAKFIQEQLSAMGIPFRSNIGTTGILAVLKGKNAEKKVIALRADMDALPVAEDCDLEYKSTVEHCMHACGHDSHVASLLGVAKVLSRLTDSFEGTVLFVFQPGEERHPGGARLMLQDGLFNEYEPALVMAQHCAVDYPVGTVAFRPGMIMASADEVKITVKGQGGHGAMPHMFNDTVLCASQIIVSLQQIRARLSYPFTPMVLSFGRIIAEGSTNVIPEEVELHGTLRTMDEKWRAECKAHITRISEETALAHSCTAEVIIQDGYPSVNNDTELTEKCKQFASEFLGEDKIAELEVKMTGEDFGFFTQKYPSCFYRFGIKGESNQNCGNLHTSTFKVDLQAFKTSVRTMAWLAIKNLEP